MYPRSGTPPISLDTIERNTMITLLVCGQARVGKTTTSTIIHSLAKKMDFNPVILPFAQALKEMAAAQGLTKDTHPQEYRQFCQTMGEQMRKDNPNHWIDCWSKTWSEYAVQDGQAAQCMDKLWKETVVIVDDCRYLNELNFGKSIGAKSIFISKGKRVLEDSNAAWRQHDSEFMANEYEDGNKDYRDIFDFIINNDGNVKNLQSKISSRIIHLLDMHPACYCEKCDCQACNYFRTDSGPEIADLFE